MRLLQNASREKSRGAGRVRLDFETLVAAFVEDMASRGLAPATRSTRQDSLKPLCAFLEERGIADVRHMSRADVDAYVADLRTTSRSVFTAEVRISSLKAFFGYLVDSNRLLVSPAEYVKERSTRHVLGATISAADAARVCAAPNTSLPLGVRDRALIELLYGTGLRRGEILRLSIFDLDLAGGLMRVQGKGGKERIVPLGRQAARWLADYVEKVRPQLGRRKDGRDGEHALFLGKSGLPLSGEAIAMIVKTHARAAGVEASCHTLRRTMATEMLRGGAQVTELAVLLGHVSATTTQKYTKLVPIDLRRVHERLHPRGGGR